MTSQFTTGLRRERAGRASTAATTCETRLTMLDPGGGISFEMDFKDSRLIMKPSTM